LIDVYGFTGCCCINIMRQCDVDLLPENSALSYVQSGFFSKNFKFLWPSMLKLWGLDGMNRRRWHHSITLSPWGGRVIIQVKLSVSVLCFVQKSVSGQLCDGTTTYWASAWPCCFGDEIQWFIYYRVHVSVIHLFTDAVLRCCRRHSVDGAGIYRIVIPSLFVMHICLLRSAPVSL